MDELLDYFFRYLNDELTDEEREEIIKIDESQKRQQVNLNDNQYAAFGGNEDLSLDTH